MTNEGNRIYFLLEIFNLVEIGNSSTFLGEKGMKLYTLSEAAKEIGVPVHVLGYWLKKWQIEATYRAGHVKLYDGKSLDEIRRKVDTARTVGAFTSVKCPVGVSKD